MGVTGAWPHFEERAKTSPALIHPAYDFKEARRIVHECTPDAQHRHYIFDVRAMCTRYYLAAIKPTAGDPSTVAARSQAAADAVYSYLLEAAEDLDAGARTTSFRFVWDHPSDTTFAKLTEAVKRAAAKAPPGADEVSFPPPPSKTAPAYTCEGQLARFLHIQSASEGDVEVYRAISRLVLGHYKIPVAGDSDYLHTSLEHAPIMVGTRVHSKDITRAPLSVVDRRACLGQPGWVDPTPWEIRLVSHMVSNDYTNGGLFGVGYKSLQQDPRSLFPIKEPPAYPDGPPQPEQLEAAAQTLAAQVSEVFGNQERPSTFSPALGHRLIPLITPLAAITWSRQVVQGELIMNLQNYKRGAPDSFSVVPRPPKTSPGLAALSHGTSSVRDRIVFVSRPPTKLKHGLVPIPHLPRAPTLNPQTSLYRLKPRRVSYIQLMQPTPSLAIQPAPVCPPLQALDDAAYRVVLPLAGQHDASSFTPHPHQAPVTDELATTRPTVLRQLVGKVERQKRQIAARATASAELAAAIRPAVVNAQASATDSALGVSFGPISSVPHPQAAHNATAAHTLGERARQSARDFSKTRVEQQYSKRAGPPISTRTSIRALTPESFADGQQIHPVHRSLRLLYIYLTSTIPFFPRVLTCYIEKARENGVTSDAFSDLMSPEDLTFVLQIALSYVTQAGVPGQHTIPTYLALCLKQATPALSQAAYALADQEFFNVQQRYLAQSTRRGPPATAPLLGVNHGSHRILDAVFEALKTTVPPTILGVGDTKSYYDSAIHRITGGFFSSTARQWPVAQAAFARSFAIDPLGVFQRAMVGQTRLDLGDAYLATPLERLSVQTLKFSTSDRLRAVVLMAFKTLPHEDVAPHATHSLSPDIRARVAQAAQMQHPVNTDLHDAFQSFIQRALAALFAIRSRTFWHHAVIQCRHRAGRGEPTNILNRLAVATFDDIAKATKYGGDDGDDDSDDGSDADDDDDGTTSPPLKGPHLSLAGDFPSWISCGESRAGASAPSWVDVSTITLNDYLGNIHLVAPSIASHLQHYVLDPVADSVLVARKAALDAGLAPPPACAPGTSCDYDIVCGTDLDPYGRRDHNYVLPRLSHGQRVPFELPLALLDAVAAEHRALRIAVGRRPTGGSTTLREAHSAYITALFRCDRRYNGVPTGSIRLGPHGLARLAVLKISYVQPELYDAHTLANPDDAQPTAAAVFEHALVRGKSSVAFGNASELSSTFLEYRATPVPGGPPRIFATPAPRFVALQRDPLFPPLFLRFEQIRVVRKDQMNPVKTYRGLPKTIQDVLVPNAAASRPAVRWSRPPPVRPLDRIRDEFIRRFGPDQSRWPERSMPAAVYDRFVAAITVDLGAWQQHDEAASAKGKTSGPAPAPPEYVRNALDHLDMLSRASYAGCDPGTVFALALDVEYARGTAGYASLAVLLGWQTRAYLTRAGQRRNLASRRGIIISLALPRAAGGHEGAAALHARASASAARLVESTRTIGRVQRYSKAQLQQHMDKLVSQLLRILIPSDDGPPMILVVGGDASTRNPGTRVAPFSALVLRELEERVRIDRLSIVVLRTSEYLTSQTCANPDCTTPDGQRPRTTLGSLLSSGRQNLRIKQCESCHRVGNRDTEAAALMIEVGIKALLMNRHFLRPASASASLPAADPGHFAS